MTIHSRARQRLERGGHGGGQRPRTKLAEWMTPDHVEHSPNMSELTFRERPADGEPSGLLVMHTAAAPTSTTCCRSPTSWTLGAACTWRRRARR